MDHQYGHSMNSCLIVTLYLTEILFWHTQKEKNRTLHPSPGAPLCQDQNFAALENIRATGLSLKNSLVNEDAPLKNCLFERFVSEMQIKSGESRQRAEVWGEKKEED